MTRAEFDKQYKILIKRYHPDLCTDEAKREQFEEITAELNARRDRMLSAKTVVQAIGVGGSRLNTEGIERVRDQSYAYYRQGMVLYKGINPSAWTTLSRTRHGYTHDDSRFEPEELLNIIAAILKKFGNAMYCFNQAKMVNPNAPWAEDASEKADYLRKLYPRYTAILKNMASEVLES